MGDECTGEVPLVPFGTLQLTACTKCPQLCHGCTGGSPWLTQMHA
jgi:hypothetical protein